MKTPHQKLQQLQQEWSSEMETFWQLQQSNETLMEELRGYVHRLDALGKPGNSATVTESLTAQNTSL